MYWQNPCNKIMHAPCRIWKCHRENTVQQYSYYIYYRYSSPSLTQILVVGLFLTLQVQQTVAAPQFRHAHRTHGRLFWLAVFHQQVTHADAAARHTRQPRGTRLAAVACWGMRNPVGWAKLTINYTSIHAHTLDKWLNFTHINISFKIIT